MLGSIKLDKGSSEYQSIQYKNDYVIWLNNSSYHNTYRKFTRIRKRIKEEYGRVGYTPRIREYDMDSIWQAIQYIDTKVASPILDMKLIGMDYFETQLKVAELIGKTNKISELSWARITDRTGKLKYEIIEESELYHGEIGIFIDLNRPNAKDLTKIIIYNNTVYKAHKFDPIDEALESSRYAITGYSIHSYASRTHNSGEMMPYADLYPEDRAAYIRIEKAVGLLLKHFVA